MAVSEAGFILVTESSNDRVVLLDPSLRYIRDLVSRDHGLYSPERIWLDEVRGILYVGETVTGTNVKVFWLK